MHQAAHDRENDERIIDIDTDLLVIIVVYLFPDEEGKSREKHLYSTVNGKVSQNDGKKSFFLTHEKKFETFFFFLL